MVTCYPLLFGFKDLIAGNGFFAGVTVAGRALLADEGGGFWMYGVNPGGVAAGGATAAEAQAEFRRMYTSVLFDIAAEAASFEELKAEVEQFFHATNEPTAVEWETAVADVRQGRTDADWLPKKRAESKIGVEVVLLEHAVPSVNALDEAQLAA
ncbi:hypothetical protein EHM82_06955 [bacterium]|nr:MAG: hypothetical protein EHM82_06955 [bacterium]